MYCYVNYEFILNLFLIIFDNIVYKCFVYKIFVGKIKFLFNCICIFCVDSKISNCVYIYIFVF